MELLAVLDAFFSRLGGSPGRGAHGSRVPVVVAFSGGPDSTALLWGLARLGRFDLVAAHLDHALDPGSAARCAGAARLAAVLGVPLVAARRPVRPLADPSGRRDGLEAAARRARYEFLEEVRESAGARWVATAHHRDDQAETVLLRMLFGSGLTGLAGMRPVAGAVVRPLLSLPKTALAAALAVADLPVADLPVADLPAADLLGAGLAAMDDPTNRDLTRPRNHIRHRVLPALAGVPAGRSLADGSPAATPSGAESAGLPLSAGCSTAGLAPAAAAADPWSSPADLASRLAGLADRAARAADSLNRRLAGALEPRPGAAWWGVDLDRLRELPRGLWPAALAALHRRAGAAYPPPGAAVAELASQLERAGARGSGERGRAIGCDCGAGWRWAGSGGRLELRRGREKHPHFIYTLEVPGELDIPELELRLRLVRGRVEPWMFRGEPRRAGLALPLYEGARVTVRSRLPGDRLHPLGARGGRRLKELLIDRRIPWRERERLPLLCVGGGIAWVPGVTIDERYRILRGGTPAAPETPQVRQTAQIPETLQTRETPQTPQPPEFPGMIEGEPAVWVAELSPGNPRPGPLVVEGKGPGAPSLLEVAEL
jgi:tRNA(Ile)-lysidine synthetase-like protein